MNKPDLASLIDQLQELNRRPKPDFLELGRGLARLKEAYPDDFARIAQQVGISRRRAYYVLEVYARFTPFASYHERLRAIGWTKLQLISAEVTAENIDQLLALAESASTKRVAEIVKGASPAEELRCVLLYLPPQDYARYAKAIVQHGGSQRGRQLIDQERALMSIIGKVT